MLPQLRAYLQLFRAHTAPATVLLLAGGYYAAGGRDPTTAALLVTGGILGHWGSFGHNSCSDYPYDEEDPAKQHHPLHDKRLTLLDGLYAVYTSQAISFILFTYLAWPNPHALALLGLFILTGYMYNSAGFSSRSSHASFFITASFTSLAAYAGYLATTPNWVFTATVAAIVWTQIDWLGRQKELGQPEPGYIKKLGARLEQSIAVTRKTDYAIRFQPGPAWLYMFLLTALTLTLATQLLLDHYTHWRLATLLLFGTAYLWASAKLAHPRPYDRKRDLQHMGIREASITVAAAALVTPWLPALLLVTGSLTWFALFNRFLWQTTAAPRV